MDISLNNEFCISDITANDKFAYVDQLREKQIYDQTLAIPYPYTLADAEWWISHVAEETSKQKQSVNWCLRNKEGYLIGGIGFSGVELGKSHRAEIGYWLAKPYWGQGVMSEAVGKICEYAFSKCELTRISAKVFSFNLGSARVLEKNDFLLEGLLRQHYKKDGKLFDGKLYARLKD